MSLLVVGISHRSAPVGMLERAAFGTGATEKLLGDLAGTPYVDEVVLLATCNRIEVYAEVAKFHGALADLSALIASYAGIELGELTPYLYVHYDGRAVRHLYTVACGLDSMVVGEPQVLGQIRTALETAQRCGTAGRVLNDLVQSALRVGKRAHTETALDRTGQSLVTVGLDAARQHLAEPLERCEVLVVGAGSMSALAAATLRREGVIDLAIANRTYQRAERLAAALDADTLPFERVSERLTSVDLLITCTGATGTVISLEALRRVVDAGRRLVVLDLALPRDVDLAARELPGVTVIDIETIGAAGQSSSAGPDVIEQVRALIGEELLRYDADVRAAQVAPTVAALRSKAAAVVASELERLERRLPGLDQKARQEVERTVRRVVDKLLHTPTVRVKQLATESGTSYADALRELFDLDQGAVDALCTVADESTESAALGIVTGSVETATDGRNRSSNSREGAER